MINGPVRAKFDWFQIAIEIQQFHINQVKSEPDWNLEKTAKALNRSIGSVSEYILVASWCRTHEKQIRRFNSLRDAIEFVRQRKRQLELGES